MHKIIGLFISLNPLILLGQTIFNDPIQLNYRYQDAAAGTLIKGSSISLPTDLIGQNSIEVSDPIMYKSLFLLQIITTIETTLKTYSENSHHAPLELKNIVNHWRESPLIQQLEVQDPKIIELMDNLGRLVSNIEANKFPRVFGCGMIGKPSHLFSRHLRAKMNNLCAESVRCATQLNVTTGGAQDSGHFLFAIKNGEVPTPQSFNPEGFLSEFDLSLRSKFSCDQLICVKPALAVNSEQKKLYVQLAMSTKETKISRKPINLTIVLDVSGSMQEDDETGRSRIEWTKEATREILTKLNENDFLTIVLFNQNARVLISPTPVINKDQVKAQLNQIEAKGGTNLEAGLRQAFELTSENFKQNYENRLILLSDAGLNTGIVPESELVKLVANYASEGIGLTAIGLGENFNQTLIHGITQMKGGNYIFAQSGKEIQKLSENFDLLVTPIAYDFKASLVPNSAKLVRSFGVPSSQNETIQELIDVRTLFFASSDAGGAIILEFDIP